jgi:macrolide-specific efflux system membrane fusion protein
MTPLKFKKGLPRFLVVFAALAVIAGSLLFWQQHSGSQNAKQRMHAVTVQRGNVEETVTAQGKLQPKEYVDVGVQVSGQLKKIYVAIGDDVTKGTLLADIDPTVYESKVAADEAQLKSLKAQLAEQTATTVFARQQYERNLRLIKSKAVSQELLEDTHAAFKAAEAKIQSLEAQVEQQTSALEGDKANLSYTKIYAPMDGTVVSQTAREGQTLNANQTAPIVLQIANLDIMTVLAQVAEADVMRLKPGMDVTFTTLGSQERRWHGTVRQILPTPEIVNDVVLFEALIDVENKDHELMTSMTAQVFFMVGKEENVLVVPVKALGKPLPDQDSDKGQAYQVKVRNANNDTEDRVIFIGLMTREVAEVREGLNEGDKVVVQVSDAKPAGQRPQQRGGGPRGGPRL